MRVIHRLICDLLYFASDFGALFTLIILFTIILFALFLFWSELVFIRGLVCMVAYDFYDLNKSGLNQGCHGLTLESFLSLLLTPVFFCVFYSSE